METIGQKVLTGVQQKFSIGNTIVFALNMMIIYFITSKLFFNTGYPAINAGVTLAALLTYASLLYYMSARSINKAEQASNKDWESKYNGVVEVANNNYDKWKEALREFKAYRQSVEKSNLVSNQKLRTLQDRYSDVDSKNEVLNSVNQSLTEKVRVLKLEIEVLKGVESVLESVRAELEHEKKSKAGAISALKRKLQPAMN